MKIFLIVFVLFLIILFGFIGYVSFDYIQTKNSLEFTPIILEENNASSTNNIQIISLDNISATSTVDMSSWVDYSDQELGYSLKYPDNFITNHDGLNLILALPKKDYFSWPLLDDVKIVVMASSTCFSNTLDISLKPKYLTVDDKIDFVSYKTEDVAAGTRHLRNIYEIKKDNICYSLVHSSRGTNGAGFYVNDEILVKKYDKEHRNNQDKIDQIIIGILASFNLIK